MYEFDEFRKRHSKNEGPPPVWIVVDWLREAQTLRPNVMFRQRIKEIEAFLDEAVGAMIEQMYKEFINNGGSDEDRYEEVPKLSN